MHILTQTGNQVVPPRVQVTTPSLNVNINMFHQFETARMHRERTEPMLTRQPEMRNRIPRLNTTNQDQGRNILRQNTVSLSHQETCRITTGLLLLLTAAPNKTALTREIPSHCITDRIQTVRMKMYNPNEIATVHNLHGQTHTRHLKGIVHLHPPVPQKATVLPAAAHQAEAARQPEAHRQVQAGVLLPVQVAVHPQDREDAVRNSSTNNT